MAGVRRGCKQGVEQHPRGGRGDDTEQGGAGASGSEESRDRCISSRMIFRWKPKEKRGRQKAKA
eukprot:5504570-Prorocentrum_lima.AAC.1